MCRVYFQVFTILVLLALYSIGQVSAVKCYVCDSDVDQDCIEKAYQSKFTVECSNHSFLPTSEQQGNHPNVTEYDCGYAHGFSTIFNKTRVIRGCAVKSTSCYFYEKIYKEDHNIEVDKCNRCASDLCNSSGHLNIGIWSLSLSLIALYFFKL